MTGYSITVKYRIPDDIVKNKAEARNLARENIGHGYGDWTIEEEK